MSFYETTLLELVEMVCRLGLPREYFQHGTATGGSTSTFVDLNRKEPADYFQNTSPPSRVRIVWTADMAAPKGEEREITDWSATGAGGTFDPVMTAVVGDGDKYIILHDFEWDEVVAAINDAINRAGKSMLVEAVSETQRIQSDTYEYVVPTGFTHIYRISQEDSNGDFPTPINPSHYKIIRGLENPKIHFYRMLSTEQPAGIAYGELWIQGSLSDGQILRIEGFKKQDNLEFEEDKCYIDPSYVWRQATATLRASRSRSSANDPDAHGVQAQRLAQEAGQILMLGKTQFPPNTKKVRT